MVCADYLRGRLPARLTTHSKVRNREGGHLVVRERTVVFVPDSDYILDNIEEIA